ncbi:MAG: hypothetical protein R2684_12975 [Pyrinomonadaceae bacterium]
MTLLVRKCVLPFLIIGFISGVFAQTPEVKVIFRLNGEEIEVQKFGVSIFKSGSNVSLRDLETRDNVIVVPSEFGACENFDVQVVFDNQKLIFPDFTKEHFDNEWIIDVTEPIRQIVTSKDKRQKKKLMKQYSITFHPQNKEGAYQLIEIYEN